MSAFLKSLILSAIITVIALLCIPKEYSARITLTDEVKESGLLIGLDHRAARFQELRGNDGLQNPEVYSRILNNDILAKDGIRYSFSIKKQTITIEARDQDPLQAVNKVDSIHNLLDQTIAEHRKAMKIESLKAAERLVGQTKAKYDTAFAQYAKFQDSHRSIVLDRYRAYEDSLRQDVASSEEAYMNAYKMLKRSEALANMPYPTFTVLRVPVIPNSPIYPNGWRIFITSLCCCLVLTSWISLYRKKVQLFGPEAHRLDLFHLFAPWTLNIVHWGVIMLLIWLESGLMEPLSRRFYISLTLWLIIFTASSIITFHVIPCTIHNQDSNKGHLNINQRIFDFFLYLSILLTPLHFLQIYRIASLFDLSEIMYNIRMIATYGDTNFGLLNYSMVINKAMLVVGLWQYPKIAKWKLSTLFLLNITSSLALMEKGSIFFIFFFTLFVFFEKRIIRVRTIALSSLVLLGVFFIFTLGREYRSDLSDSDIMTFSDFFAIYLLAGPVAYGRLFMDISTQFGAHTFETVYLFLDRFGFGPFVLNDKVMDFVWVPLPTNTYTIFQPFFQDFGQRGVAFFAMIYGVMSGALYRLYRHGNSTCSSLYAYMVVALLLQFHQEEIFLSLVHVIQFTFFVTLFTTKFITINGLFNRR